MKSFSSHYTTVETDEASALGYESITTPYSPNEKLIFDRALADQKGTDFLVVAVLGGNHLEIWRKRSELKRV